MKQHCVLDVKQLREKGAKFVVLRLNPSNHFADIQNQMEFILNLDDIEKGVVVLEDRITSGLSLGADGEAGYCGKPASPPFVKDGKEVKEEDGLPVVSRYTGGDVEAQLIYQWQESVSWYDIFTRIERFNLYYDEDALGRMTDGIHKTLYGLRDLHDSDGYRVRVMMSFTAKLQDGTVDGPGDKHLFGGVWAKATDDSERVKKSIRDVLDQAYLDLQKHPAGDEGRLRGCQAQGVEGALLGQEGGTRQ